MGQKAQNRIQAWLVGIDPFSAFLLMMTLFRAEHACHLVLVGVNPRVEPIAVCLVGQQVAWAGCGGGVGGI